jgi:hypothetical protein
MLNAPATGEAMSELILDGAARHVDLVPFAPGRLSPLDPARLRDPPRGTGAIQSSAFRHLTDALHDEGTVSCLTVTKAPSQEHAPPTAELSATRSTPRRSTSCKRAIS